MINLTYRGPWKKKLNIKQFLNDDDSDENAVEVGHKLAEYLRQNLSEYPRIADFDKIVDCDHFNARLTHLYDYADKHRSRLGAI